MSASLLDKVKSFAEQLDLFGETSFSLPVPLVPSATPVSGRRRILLKHIALEYELRRSKRRSIGFLVHEQGLRITAPRWVSIAEIEDAIRSKQDWILKKLVERREREVRQTKPAHVWREGGQLDYFGQTLRLRLAGEHSHHQADAQELCLNLPSHADAQQIKDSAQAWLQQQALSYFLQRLPEFADRLGVHYRSVALSSAKTRWGSCTSDGRIRLNWRLIHFSPAIIDYVIAHELAHLREMNHGPRFWATVQAILPDFEQARAQLRKHGAHDLPDLI